jgi:hypothetical protein
MPYKFKKELYYEKACICIYDGSCLCADVGACEYNPCAGKLYPGDGAGNDDAAGAGD